MLIWPDCIPCIITTAFSLARQTMERESDVMSFMKEITDRSRFGGASSALTAVDIIQEMWLTLIRLTGDTDPLKKVKAELNDIALRLYPAMKERVIQSPDPLAEAVRLAIAGNSLDAMRDGLARPAEETFTRFSTAEVNAAHLENFRQRLGRARRIVYLGDNCGEIVFDRLLVETILQSFAGEITFVARSLPVLNDATLVDATSVNLDAVLPVIENGGREPLPGTVVSKVSSRLRKLIDEADLLISKGGGNHDSLTEEPTVRGRTTFLFQAKCRPYSVMYGIPQNGLIVYNG